MNNQPLISVIVPVYNAEKYLDKCIESIINQEYSNLEIILVNDGSKDHSLSVCKQYQRNDSRIVIVNQKNGGPSVARNSGLDVATGDYIGFVDSDDIIEKDMYKILMKNLLDANAQMAAIGMEYCYLNGDKKPYYQGETKRCIENEDILSTFLSNTVITFGPVDKLYSRDSIGSIRFDTQIKMCEDQKFVYEVIKNINKVIYDPKICYHINCTNDSLSRAKADRYHLAMLDVNEYIYEELTKSEDKIKSRLYNVDLCLSYFVIHYHNGQFIEEDIDRIDKIIRDNTGVVMKEGSTKQKIKLILYRISPKLLRYVVNQFT